MMSVQPSPASHVCIKVGNVGYSSFASLSIKSPPLLVTPTFETGVGLIIIIMSVSDSMVGYMSL